MDEATIRRQMRAFILNELVREPDYPLRDDEGIISSGLMDSFALAELGVYVEDAFDVYIPDADLTVAKMDSLNQMVARVLRDLPA
ncbi:MAG: acyl carrier protein [Ardenticatenaceae bacterium]|nr:acyl carrier protein [Ardenticatenaceae bacterium]